MPLPDPSVETLPPGTVVASRFRIDALLGQGGMAEVYRATELPAERPVALKVLRTAVAGNPEAVSRLKREGELLSNLRHPGIVAFDRFGQTEDGRIFLAMELLSGETLGARMRRGPMTVAELAPVLRGAAAGLDGAHKSGVVHRDLKPDNIFLCSGPDGSLHVKILDFGISKVFGGERLTQTGQVLGTPRYMAPEQLSADRDLDARIDVYAMGVILYEALAGHPPFVAGTPSDLIVSILHGKAAPLRSYRPDLPPEVEAIVQRAMARSREARYPGMRALADVWEEVAGALRMPGPDAPRPGMRTNVMGSMGSPYLADLARRGGDSVRPGTFSGLAATQLPGAAAALAAAPVTPPPVAEPRTSFPAVGSDPGVGASLRSDPGSEPRSDPGREAYPGPAIDHTGRRSAVSAVPPLRTSGSRIALIVGACVAGGLSAAAVIIGLQYLAASEREEPPPPREGQGPPPTKQVVPQQLAGEVPPGVEPSIVEPPPAPPVEGAPEPPMQTGAEPPAGPPAEEPPSDPRREKRRDIRSDRGRPDDPEGPRALLRQARDALNQRDYRACITLAERAMEAGAGLNGLRVRADCLYYSGDRSEALKAYERFCRAAPDHPSILEVAQRVLELGGSCRTEAPEPPPPPWTP